MRHSILFSLSLIQLASLVGSLVPVHSFIQRTPCFSACCSLEKRGERKMKKKKDEAEQKCETRWGLELCRRSSFWYRRGLISTNLMVQLVVFFSFLGRYKPDSRWNSAGIQCFRSYFRVHKSVCFRAIQSFCFIFRSGVSITRLNVYSLNWRGGVLTFMVTQSTTNVYSVF